MPLSPPVARERAHTRTIELNGYSREDGLFDVEARLTDTKAYGFPTEDRGRIDAGEPLHGMSMRMTVDEDMTIVQFEAATDYSPYTHLPRDRAQLRQAGGDRDRPGLPACGGRARGRRPRLHPPAGAAAADGHRRLPDAVSHPRQAERREGSRPAKPAEHLLRLPRGWPGGGAALARIPYRHARCRRRGELSGAVRLRRGRRGNRRVHPRSPPVGRSV